MKLYQVKGKFSIHQDLMNYIGTHHNCSIQYKTGGRSYYNKRISFEDKRRTDDEFYEDIKSFMRSIDIQERSRVFIANDVSIFFRVYMGMDIDFTMNNSRLQQTVRLDSPHFEIDRIQHGTTRLVRQG